MSAEPRIAGVDYGTKKIGLAVTDPLRLFTRPVGTYGEDGLVEALREIEREDGLETIVVGWPLTKDGEEGVQTERVVPFLERLRETFPKVEVVRWDERYSSVRAREKIREAGQWRKVREDHTVVDAVAAAVILEEYIEQHQELMR